MEELSASLIGDQWAESYDDYHPPLHRTDPMVRTLTELSLGGPVLELGVGTGRVALALAAEGIEVHGVDVSEEMVQRLRKKPGGEGVHVIMQDFTEFQTERRYPLIFVALNTFFLLLSQAAQVQAFKNVARHLAPRGVFAIEASVPEPGNGWGTPGIRVYSLEPSSTLVGAIMHDSVRQRIDLQVIHITDSGCRLRPVHSICVAFGTGSHG